MSIAKSRPSNRAIYARGINCTRYLSSPYDTPYVTIISADSTNTNTNTTSAGYISKSKLPISIIIDKPLSK